MPRRFTPAAAAAAAAVMAVLMLATITPVGASVIPPPGGANCRVLWFHPAGDKAVLDWINTCLDPAPSSGPHEMIAEAEFGGQPSGKWQNCSITIQIYDMSLGGRKLGGAHSKDCLSVYKTGVPSTDKVELPPILGQSGHTYMARAGLDCNYGGSSIQQCEQVAPSPNLTIP